MFPWWISWFVHWWPCIGCSFIVLITHCQSKLTGDFDLSQGGFNQYYYKENPKNALMSSLHKGESFINMEKSPSYENKFIKRNYRLFGKMNNIRRKRRTFIGDRNPFLNDVNSSFVDDISFSRDVDTIFKDVIYPFKNVISPLYDFQTHIHKEKQYNRVSDVIEDRTYVKSIDKYLDDRPTIRYFDNKPTEKYINDSPTIKYMDDGPTDDNMYETDNLDSIVDKKIYRENEPPHLKFPDAITSYEVPSLQREFDKEIQPNPTISEEIFKDKRHPFRKISRIVNSSEKSKQNAKRIMKTLVTTPKRIIGSLQGMGGSAVKPAGSSIQHFATQPAPQTAVVGSTAVLPCRVMRKVGHLQWTKDGFGMGTDRDLFGFSRYAMIGDDDEGDFSLRIQPVLLEDDALFQCQVSAIDGIPGIRSKPVRLTVYVPPDPPRVSPLLLETTSGTTVTLECTSIGGRPPPEIQWVDDSRRETIHRGSVVLSELMEDRKRSIVTSRLTFTPSRYHDNQSVTCVTSNQALSSPLSSSISLSVMFPPEVILSSHPAKLIEGDDVTFTCEAQANPSLVTYRWFLNGLPLINRTLRSLKLEKISRSLHENIISCEVSNRVGTSKKDRNVTVRYGPTFRSMPRDVMSEVGQEATLKCNIDSNPEASIVWLRKGSNKIIGSGSSLTIRVNASSAGTYSCIASVRGIDFEFPELAGNVKLLLKGPPTIISESEQQGRLGDTVSVICSTVSVPSPIKVTWTYNGREIDLNDPRYEVVEDEKSEKTRNILVIHDSASSDFGAYNCSVVNEYGVARKLITLQPEKRIPIMVIVGSVVTIVVIFVVILSLVLCNKRHTVKGTGSPEIRVNNYESQSEPEKDFQEITNTKDSYCVQRENKTLVGNTTDPLPKSPLQLNRHSNVDNRHSTVDNRHTPVENRHSSLDNRHPSLDNKYSSVDNRHSSLENRHSSLDNRHSSLDNRHPIVDNRHTSVDNKYSSVDKYSSIENKYSSVENKYSSVDNKYSSVDNKYSSMDNKHSLIENRHSSIDNRHTLIENRYSSIDSRHTSGDNSYPSIDRHTPIDNKHHTIDSRHNSLERRHYSVDSRNDSGGRRKSYHLEGNPRKSLLHSLSGEINHKTHSDTLQVTFEDEYIASRSQSHSNLNYSMSDLGRRTMTQTSLLPSSPQKYADQSPLGYSSLRRTPRDHSPSGYSSLRRTPHTYSAQRSHHLSPQHNGQGNLSLSKSPLIPNGSALAYSSPKRPNYSPSSGSWSPTPLPPPYQRNTLPNGRTCNSSESARPSSRLSNPVNRNADKVTYTTGSKAVSGATYL